MRKGRRKRRTGTQTVGAGGGGGVWWRVWGMRRWCRVGVCGGGMCAVCVLGSTWGRVCVVWAPWVCACGMRLWVWGWGWPEGGGARRDSGPETHPGKGQRSACVSGSGGACGEWRVRAGCERAGCACLGSGCVCALRAGGVCVRVCVWCAGCACGCPCGCGCGRGGGGEVAQRQRPRDTAGQRTTQGVCGWGGWGGGRGVWAWCVRAPGVCGVGDGAGRVCGYAWGVWAETEERRRVTARPRITQCVRGRVWGVWRVRAGCERAGGVCVCCVRVWGRDVCVRCV